MLSGNECQRIATRTENYVFHKFLSTSKTAKRVASVAGVRKGRGRELGRETTREGGGGRGTRLLPSLLARSLAFLSRLELPFTSLSNACHAGYEKSDNWILSGKNLAAKISPPLGNWFSRKNLLMPGDYPKGNGRSWNWSMQLKLVNA